MCKTQYNFVPKDTLNVIFIGHFDVIIMIVTAAAVPVTSPSVGWFYVCTLGI